MHELGPQIYPAGYDFDLCAEVYLPFCASVPSYTDQHVDCKINWNDVGHCIHVTNH